MPHTPSIPGCSSSSPSPHHLWALGRQSGSAASSGTRSQEVDAAGAAARASHSLWAGG